MSASYETGHREKLTSQRAAWPDTSAFSRPEKRQPGTHQGEGEKQYSETEGQRVTNAQRHMGLQSGETRKPSQDNKNVRDRTT